MNRKTNIGVFIKIQFTLSSRWGDDVVNCLKFNILYLPAAWHNPCSSTGAMIIINETYAGESEVIIQVEGKLDSESVVSLRDLCRGHIFEKRNIRLNLQKLLWVDRDGLDYLRSIQKNVRLEGLNPYFKLELNE